MRHEVAAVIPTHRPDEDELIALVDALVADGLAVVVSDDASPCTTDPLLRVVGEHAAVVVRHRRNAGIARSLNAEAGEDK
jgi:GT2 family glycosyltransferase